MSPDGQAGPDAKVCSDGPLYTGPYPDGPAFLTDHEHSGCYHDAYQNYIDCQPGYHDAYHNYGDNYDDVYQDYGDGYDDYVNYADDFYSNWCDYIDCHCYRDYSESHTDYPDNYTDYDDGRNG